MLDLNDLKVGAFPADDKPSLSDTIAHARAQQLRMNLVIGDLRIKYHMTGMFGLVLGIASVGTAMYGGLQLAGREPMIKDTDPSLLVAGGVLLLVFTVGLAAQRMSVLGVLLRAMRRELGILEVATRQAEDDMIELARGD